LQSSASIALVQVATVAADDVDVALHAVPVQHIGESFDRQSARVTPATKHRPVTCAQNSVTMVVH
jgi:hypothetical protein